MTLLEKLNIFYNSYVLTIITVGYVAGELGHYLIGITSKQTAIDLDYGDHACQQNSTLIRSSQLPVQCSAVTEPERYVHVIVCECVYACARECGLCYTINSSENALNHFHLHRIGKQ